MCVPWKEGNRKEDCNVGALIIQFLALCRRLFSLGYQWAGAQWTEAPPFLNTPVQCGLLPSMRLSVTVWDPINLQNCPLVSDEYHG
jgi:hypothetical protein